MVGTVKKSRAAMASRWFRRKASQRLARPGSLGARFIQREIVLSEPSMRSSPHGSVVLPSWVLGDHTGDQFPNHLRRRSSTNLLPNSGDQPPVHTKACPVPAHDSFRGDQDERIFPSRPDASSYYPEKLIEQAEDRARMSTFQRDELLAQIKILEKETSPPAKEAAQHSKAEPDEAKHGHDL